MPHHLTDGFDELDPNALRARFVAARQEAAAARADGAVAEAEALMRAGLCAGIRAIADALQAGADARPLPVPPAPRRTLADLPAAAAAGAARNTARPAPMRRIPVPARPADDEPAPAATAPAGDAGPAPALPAAAPARPAPVARPGRLAALRRPPSAEPDERPEAPARPPLQPTSFPTPRFVPAPLPPGEEGLDPAELIAFRAHQRSATALPLRRPDGSVDWTNPALDPADLEIPF